MVKVQNPKKLVNWHWLHYLEGTLNPIARVLFAIESVGNFVDEKIPFEALRVFCALSSTYFSSDILTFLLLCVKLLGYSHTSLQQALRTKQIA